MRDLTPALHRQEERDAALTEVRTAKETIDTMESQRGELLDYVQHQSEEVRVTSSCRHTPSSAHKPLVAAATAELRHTSGFHRRSRHRAHTGSRREGSREPASLAWRGESTCTGAIAKQTRHRLVRGFTVDDACDGCCRIQELETTLTKQRRVQEVTEQALGSQRVKSGVRVLCVPPTLCRR